MTLTPVTPEEREALVHALHRPAHISQSGNLPPASFLSAEKGFIARLPRKLLATDPQAVPDLCAVHTPLNRNIVSSVKRRIELEAGPHTNMLVSLPPDHKPASLNILVSALHRIHAFALPVEDYLKLNVDTAANVQGLYQRGCNACFLAAVGGDEKCVWALRTAILVRQRKEGGMSERASLGMWVQAWLRLMPEEARERIVTESERVAREVRRVLRRYGGADEDGPGLVRLVDARSGEKKLQRRVGPKTGEEGVTWSKSDKHHHHHGHQHQHQHHHHGKGKGKEKVQHENGTGSGTNLGEEHSERKHKHRHHVQSPPHPDGIPAEQQAQLYTDIIGTLDYLSDYLSDSDGEAAGAGSRVHSEYKPIRRSGLYRAANRDANGLAPPHQDAYAGTGDRLSADFVLQNRYDDDVRDVDRDPRLPHRDGVNNAGNSINAGRYGGGGPSQPWTRKRWAEV